MAERGRSRQRAEVDRRSGLPGGSAGEGRRQAQGTRARGLDRIRPRGSRGRRARLRIRPPGSSNAARDPLVDPRSGEDVHGDGGGLAGWDRARFLRVRYRGQEPALAARLRRHRGPARRRHGRRALPVLVAGLAVDRILCGQEVEARRIRRGRVADRRLRRAERDGWGLGPGRRYSHGTRRGAAAPGFGGGGNPGTGDASRCVAPRDLSSLPGLSFGWPTFPLSRTESCRCAGQRIRRRHMGRRARRCPGRAGDGRLFQSRLCVGVPSHRA